MPCAYVYWPSSMIIEKRTLKLKNMKKKKGGNTWRVHGFKASLENQQTQARVVHASGVQFVQRMKHAALQQLAQDQEEKSEPDVGVEA